MCCCVLLQGRPSDQGPPWLLRQALQPEILSALESPATTELLHGIYIFLAGRSANTQDLSMHLSDLRLGLRFAAGYRATQDLQQQQTQQAHGGARRMQRVGGGSSSRSPQRRQLVNGTQQQQHGYHSSTESSRGRATDAVPYSISLLSSCSHGSSGSSMHVGRDGRGNSGARSFQLPLYKVAAFIRTAKLIPRLLDKYLAQVSAL